MTMRTGKPADSDLAGHRSFGHRSSLQNVSASDPDSPGTWT
jgi:hypothetical protein